MAISSSVAVGPNIGPVYIKKEKRDQYAQVLSETCSLTDRVFKDSSSKQILQFNDSFYNNPLITHAMPSYVQLAKEYKGMMREHIERRVLFFFQQLIVCYQTKLHFESVGAQDQASSASSIFVKIKGEQQKLTVRNAAHSSTSPCLVAYDNQEWQQYKAGLKVKPQGFVFLKGTDYYRTANATMNMPRMINEADREIDEKTSESLLRGKSEAIINKVAQGDLTPDAGLIQFLEDAILAVEDAQERLANKDKDPDVQEVLKYYLKYLNKCLGVIESDSTFLGNFLNIKIDSSEHDDAARRIILNIRYSAIRNVQLEQSKLIQKVEALKKEIFDGLDGTKKPDNFDAAFRTKMIEAARTDLDRQRLEKLLNFSPENFKAQLSKSINTKFTNTLGLLSPHTNRIQFVVQEILQDMRHLRTQEQYDRAQILKALRKMKQWTQKELGAAVKNLFAHAAASQPTISRIESREKLVTPQIAEEFSQVFKVDPGLFMPHFFYA